MNYMEQVAQMLGVELEEEFKLNDSDDYKYKITKDGMFMYSEFASDWFSANHILLGVLFGKYEIEKPILDDIEKEYLSGVIKPFRNKLISITKLDSEEMNGYEYICIEHREVCNDRYYINLPCFKKGTIYKGMETDKAYSMEDMGL